MEYNKWLIEKIMSGMSNLTGGFRDCPGSFEFRNVLESFLFEQTELPPCPVCGKELDPSECEDGYFHTCTDCDFDSPYCDTVQEAIDVWLDTPYCKLYLKDKQ